MLCTESLTMLLIKKDTLPVSKHFLFPHKESVIFFKVYRLTAYHYFHVSKAISRVMS